MSPKKAIIIEHFLVFFVFFIYSYCVSLPRPTLFENHVFLSIFQKIAKLIAALLPFLFYLQKPHEFVHTLTRPKAFLCLAGYFTLSPIWATEPYVASKEVVLLWLAIFFVVYLARNFSLERILFFVLSTQLLGACVSLIFWWWYPAESWASTTLGSQGEVIWGFKGSYSHKNHLALAMNLSILSVFTLWLMRKISLIFAVPLLTVFGLLLFWSRSAANFIALILTVLTVLIVQLLLLASKKQTRIIFISVSLLFLILIVFVWTNYPQLTEKMNRPTNLTGRTRIWKESVNAISERPFLGYGLNSFWPSHKKLEKFSSAIQIWKNLGFRTPSAHNGYIDLILSGGWVGFLFGILVFIELIRKFLVQFNRLKRTSKGLCFFSGFFALMLVINLVESFWLATRYIYFLIFLFLCFSEGEDHGAVKTQLNTLQTESPKNQKSFQLV